VSAEVSQFQQFLVDINHRPTIVCQEEGACSSRVTQKSRRLGVSTAANGFG